MSVRKSRERAWRAIAALLTSLSVLGCSDDGASGQGPATTSPAGNTGSATAAADAGGSPSLATGAAAASAGHAGSGGSTGE